MEKQNDTTEPAISSNGMLPEVKPCAWISICDHHPKGGKRILVADKFVREGYYNAGFNTWHIRSTMPDEQGDEQIYPTHWMEMPEAPSVGKV